ncbi:MAG: DUF1048 domain-containing protein [Trebonia sp.]
MHLLETGLQVIRLSPCRADLPARYSICLDITAGYLPCYFPLLPFRAPVRHQIQRQLLQSLPAARAIQQYASWRTRIPKLIRDAHLFPYGGFTGRNLMPIMDNALGLLEETAADGQDIREVLGDDIKGFCAALAGGEGARSYRDRWREQLNRNVARKLGRLGG